MVKKYWYYIGMFGIGYIIGDIISTIIVMVR